MKMYFGVGEVLKNYNLVLFVNSSNKVYGKVKILGNCCMIVFVDFLWKYLILRCILILDGLCVLDWFLYCVVD